MEKAARNLQFEKAAEIRDKIKNIKNKDLDAVSAITKKRKRR